LDELGILVRLDDATEQYAAQLGVAASSLTNFQRSQAFANATIDQGLQKYESLANVELSGFSKLAATFSDLGHTIIGFVSSALEPLASFLASSQVALFGLLAALTKGIVGQALPFLTEFSQKAAQSASNALGLVSAEKERADKAAKANRKLISSVSYLNEKEKELVKSIKKGEAPLQEQEDLLRKLVAREKSRVAALDTVADKTAKKYKNEIKSLNKIIPKLERQIQLEKERAGVSGGLSSARGDAQLSGVESKIMGSLDRDMSFKNFQKQLKRSTIAGAAYRKRMKEADTATLMFGKRIPFLSRALGKGGIAFKSFGLTAKTALKGITFAIPIFGQVLFAFELLRSGITSLMEMFGKLAGNSSELSLAADTLGGAFETYAEQTKKTLEPTERNSKTLKALGKSASGLVKSMNDYRTAQVKAQEEASIFGRILLVLKDIGAAFAHSFVRDFQDLGIKIQLVFANLRLSILEFFQENKSVLGTLQDSLNTIFEHFGQKPIQLLDEKGNVKGLDTARKTVDTLQDMVDRRFDFQLQMQLADAFRTGRSSVDTFVAVMEQGGLAMEEMHRIIGSTNINDFFRDIAGTDMQGLLTNLDKLPPELQKIINKVNKQEKAVLSTNEVLEIFAELVGMANKPIIEAGNNITSLESAVTDSTKGFTTFILSLQGSGNTFSKLRDVVDPIVQSFETLARTNMNEAIEQVNKLSDRTKRLMGITKGMTDDEIAAQVTAFGALIRESDNLTRSEKRRLSLIKDQLSVLKKIIKENRAGLELALQKENQSRRVSLELIERQIQSRRQSLGEELSLTEIQQIAIGNDKQRAATAQELLNFLESQRKLETDILSPREQGLKLSLQDMDRAKKRLDISKSRQKVEQNQLKVQQQIQNLAGGKGAVQTETQTFEIQQMAAKAKISAAEADFNLAQARFQLELELLQMELRRKGESEETIRKVTASSKAVFDITKAQAQVAIDGAKAELRILQLSRSVSASAAIGVDKSGSQIEKVVAAVEKLQSRAKAELGVNTGVLTANRKKLIEELERTRAEIISTQALPDPTSSGMHDGALKALQGQATDLEARIISTGGALNQSALSIVAESFAPFIEELAKLGPDGEITAALAEGSIIFAEGWITAANKIKESLGTLQKDGTVIMENVGQKWGEMARIDQIDLITQGAAVAVGQLNAINSVLDAQSRKSVKQVQQQIDVEKKRDGKSAESLARLKQLDKKKESMERKAFERNKKIAIANALISTASGMIGVFRGLDGLTKFPLAAIAAGAIGVLGAAQIALIASQSYQGGGGSPSSGMPSSIGAGERRSSVDLARSQSARGEIAYFRGGQGQGGPENFTPAFAGARYRATGGETAGYVVGEQGPELFVPQTPGRVVSNDDVGEMVGTANVNFSINAIDASGVEDILVSQRGNIIGMIREAANSYGQEFVEGVDTSVYTPSAGGVSKY
jgi:hypothetical protein